LRACVRGEFRLHHSALNDGLPEQVFCDLHGIGGGTFA
jgi:hypothetical protein